jgi:ribose transport system ATP-binding protein
MTMNARENLTLPLLAPLRGAAGHLSGRAEREEAERWVATVGIVPPDPERQLALFSGGNQQKAVIAKWLRTTPRVLLLDEPTQGVDVGAKAAVYGLVARAARDGAAVLLSSSDTKELAQLCDRVLVLRDGAVVAEVAGTALTEARLVRECLGVAGEVAS